MAAWTARGGWNIEAIVLDTTPCYRVLRHGVPDQLLREPGGAGGLNWWLPGWLSRMLPAAETAQPSRVLVKAGR